MPPRVLSVELSRRSGRTVTVLCVSSDGCLVDNRSGIRESGCFNRKELLTLNGASAQLAADKRFNFISK